MGLSQKISQRILTDGPISLAEFMNAALADPEFGYYMTRDPFGPRGDFITAPEISQVFGELIGLWCAAFWLQINRPPHIHLVELGPGRGTLMADALRAANSVPGFSQALEVHLVEISPKLMEIQRKTLASSGHKISWHTRFEDIPEGLTIVIANELFDALPIRQFIRTKPGWCERLVGLDANNQFKFVISPTITPNHQTGISPQLIDAPVDSLTEICEPALAIIRTIGNRLQAHGGAALIIDYGYLEPTTGETLQAVSDHKFADVLQHPGKQDLTAHVNFASLAHSARDAGLAVFAPLTQAQFLQAMGLDTRVATLTNATTPAQACDIKAAATRLVAPEQMGTLFKVMAMTAPDCAPPAPFT